MALRSDGRKLSFEILSQSSSLVDDEALVYGSDSDPIQSHVSESKTTEKPKCKKRRHRKGSKRKKTIESAITEDPIAEQTVDPDSVFNHSESTNTFAGDSDAFSIFGNGERDYTNCTNGLESKCMSYSVVCEEIRVAEESVGSVCTVTEVTEPEFQKVRGEGFNFGELRQRVSGTGDDAAASRVEDNESEKGVEVSSAAKQRGEPNGSVVANTLETAESLDWKRLMAEDPSLGFSVETSPLKYFMEEMHNGNSLRSTTTLGNEKERERVYDTIFRLPWRCELLIDVGFFVCFDSFLSLLTVMPTRIVMTLWRLLCTSSRFGLPQNCLILAVFL